MYSSVSMINAQSSLLAQHLTEHVRALHDPARNAKSSQMRVANLHTTRTGVGRGFV